MRFAICNETFGDTPFDQVCQTASRLGYQGLEIAPFTLAPHVDQISASQRQQIKAQAAAHHLEIVGLHWLLANVQAEPPGLYMTSPDKGIQRNTADYFSRLVQLCNDLGGKIMVIGSPKQRNLLPGVTREQAMEYAANVFRPCLNLAADKGITLAIEPLGPTETDFLLTAADGIELIERIDHPNFRLHLDVKAMSSEPTPIPQIIRSSAKYLAHFHANDPNLLGPGMGEVRFEPIIQALRDIGYEGYLSVEVFDYRPGAQTIARQSIEYLRHIVSGPTGHSAA